jgi:hypothetical protein
VECVLGVAEPAHGAGATPRLREMIVMALGAVRLQHLGLTRRALSV